MANLIFVDDELSEDDDYTPPAYSVPGRIMFRTFGPETDWSDIEIIDYDIDTSVFWIQEGMGIRYWVHYYIDMGHYNEGTYVVEGITGSVHQDYFGEVDEDWDFDNVRPATPDEIADQCLV